MQHQCSLPNFLTIAALSPLPPFCPCLPYVLEPNEANGKPDATSRSVGLLRYKLDFESFDRKELDSISDTYSEEVCALSFLGLACFLLFISEGGAAIDFCRVQSRRKTDSWLLFVHYRRPPFF